MNKPVGDAAGRRALSLAAVLIAAAALGFGWSGWRAAGRSGAAVSEGLAALQSQVEGLQARLDVLQRRVAERAAAGSPRERPTVLPGDALAVGRAAGAPSRLPPLPGGDGTNGSAAASTLAGVSPEALRSIQADYEKRKGVEARLQTIRALRQQQAERDVAAYGAVKMERLNALFAQAVNAEGAERDTAMVAMLDEFPDAATTGKAVAERALEAAMEGDVAAVEQYYGELAGKESFKDIVTDMDVEAVPTVSQFLVNYYIRDGNYGRARELLGTLTSEYSESYITQPGQDGQPQRVAVQEVYTAMEQVLTSAEQGGAGVITAPPGAGSGGGGTSGGGSPAPPTTGGGGAPGGGQPR